MAPPEKPGLGSTSLEKARASTTSESKCVQGMGMRMKYLHRPCHSGTPYLRCTAVRLSGGLEFALVLRLLVWRNGAWSLQ